MTPWMHHCFSSIRAAHPSSSIQAVKFRAIPTTGSTYVAYSPGIMVNVFNFASAYFIAQIPIHRDFNGNLEQQISYIFGVTKSFQLFGGSS